MLSIDIALLVLRLVVGLLFVGHGSQKLFGWFGGGGLEGTASMTRKLNLSPATFWAFIIGLSELLGGLGLALGLLTPFAAALLIGVMLMAIGKVHWQNGLWNSKGGFEYPLLNLVVAGLIGLAGSGQYALDALLNIGYPMPLAFIIGLVVVILGLLAAEFSGEILPEAGME
ncbi:MAG: DoxX family protein [Candidatus Promineifilaceae bacterium]